MKLMDYSHKWISFTHRHISSINNSKIGGSLESPIFLQIPIGFVFTTNKLKYDLLYI